MAADTEGEKIYIFFHVDAAERLASTPTVHRPNSTKKTKTYWPNWRCVNTQKLNANMTRARKAGIGKLLLFSFANAKTKRGCGSRKTLHRPWDPAYNLFNTLATLFFHFDADQNTSSTLNLTGLLALRRLLALTSCGQKKKGCRINFQFAKTSSPKSSALQLGWQVLILVSFFLTV